MNKLEALIPEATYHVYNRANGSEKMFLSDENYHFFLRKYKQHIQPIAETFCYCLMPNHFHFMIRVREENELMRAFPKFETLERLDLALSKQFSNFFSSYTQAFNKQQNRRGSLFMKNYNRIQVSDQEQLINLVRYIHFNPIAAKLCSTPDTWKFSSYQSIISYKPSLIARNEVISWFDSLENFKFHHRL